MPQKNIVFVLQKAYVLSRYIMEDKIIECLFFLGEKEEDVKNLERERKECGLDWQSFYQMKMEKWFV